MPLIGLILQLIGFICISLTYALHTSPHQAKSSWFAVCLYIYIYICPASEVSTWQEKNTQKATAFTLIPFRRWRLNCHSDRFPWLAPWNEYLMSFILHVTNTSPAAIFFFLKYTQKENELIQIISDPRCVCLTKKPQTLGIVSRENCKLCPSSRQFKSSTYRVAFTQSLQGAIGICWKIFLLLLPQAWPPVGRRQWLHKKKHFS